MAIAAVLVAVVAAFVAPAAADIKIPVQAPFPKNNALKHGIITAPTVTWDGVNYPFDYNTIIRSGEIANVTEKIAFGTLLDIDGQPVYKVDRFGNPNITEQQGEVVGQFEISPNEDFTSLLQVGGRLFSFVHFEAPNPSISYMIELQQDVNTCHLKAISQKPVNWSAWGGLWTPCAGSVSPWGTHLGSEEYEPNGRPFAEAKNLTDLRTKLGSGWATIQNHLRYWDIYPNETTYDEVMQYFKPYMYGHATEMIAKADGSYEVKKLLALGRLAYELPYVMPDNRTVYNTDDGDNVMLTMFRADKPNDLSCGTLYGAKFNQTSNVGGGNFTVTWINMGYACQNNLTGPAQTLKFTDMFDVLNATNGSCPADFKSVNTGSYGIECLKLKPGQEILASRFETRRYLAYLGGTTEFSKWEGITFAPKHGVNGVIYTSMSDIRNGMEDRKVLARNDTRFDIGGPNDVRLEYNPCGCVYGLDVDANFTATKMWPLICGNPKSGNDSVNFCDINGIANPDNVAMLSGHNALIIGEDTVGGHQNDVIWLYQFSDKSIARMQTTPYGAETTSPYFHPNVNGCAYIMSVIQHPYGESDQDTLNQESSSGKAGVVGYLGPLKAAKADMATVSTASTGR